MTALEDLARSYRVAHRELQEMLFGDGEYTIGLVKGEERREQAARVLRRMRQAFDAVLEAEKGRAERAEAVVVRPARRRALHGRPASRSPKRVRSKRQT